MCVKYLIKKLTSSCKNVNILPYFCRQMKLSATQIKSLLKRKLATAVFITVSVAAFATLGDGGRKKDQARTSYSSKFAYTAKNFSLRSGYNYKGNNILNTQNTPRFIILNTTVTYQKGNTTYVLPLKKKVILDKVNFNPATGKF